MTNTETYRLCACGCGNRIFKPFNTSIWPKYYFGHAPKTLKPKKLIAPKIAQEKKTKKAIGKQLDNAWSLLVKLNAGMKCEYCGNKTNLNSHHIYSRGKNSVRWCLDDGICLCVGHHIGMQFSAHKTPASFIMWLIGYKGSTFMENLQWKSNQTSHLSEFDKKIILEELKAKIAAFNLD